MLKLTIDLFRHGRQHGNMATPGRYLPVRIWQRIRDLAKLGWRQTKIAQECDVDPKTVRKHWPDGEVERPPRGRPGNVGQPPATCLRMM